MSSSRPDTVAALIEVAAEAIRAANHRTLTPGRLLVPEVYTVLGDLSAFAWRLPQLHEQLARNLQHRNTAGGLRLDVDSERRYPDPGHAITDAAQALEAAAQAAHHLAAAVDHAHNAVAVIADHAPRGPRQ